MKKIPIRTDVVQIQIQQKIDQEYFLYSGIFIHLWALFEWCVTDILVLNINNLLRIKEKWKKIKESDKIKENFIKNSVEDLRNYIFNDLSTGNRFNLLKALGGFGKILKLKKDPQNLRDTIAHNNMSFSVNIGCYQFKMGWIKRKFDIKLTDEYQKRMLLAKQNNPNIKDEEINRKIYDTYSKQDIQKMVELLTQMIGDLGYDVSTNRPFLYVKEKKII